MGIFDFFRRTEPAKKPTVSRPSNSVESESVESETVRRPVSSQEVKATKPKKVSLKVTDTAALEKCLQLENPPQNAEMVFYCPIRQAKIFCHSVLIDKLGDLTKFIVASLYKGHSIAEIGDLTQMGSTTVKEELDYLIRGGLIENDEATLTELGNQYGKLLELFDVLSDGINVAFNVLLDEFEQNEEEKYTNEADPKYILRGHFIPPLARNDNYSNSLKIAQSQIVSDFPFCREIKSSLYATVRIEKEETRYKVVRIRDFDRGFSSESEQCVKIAIPCDRISYKPRYSWIDQYRDVIPQINKIYEKYDDLLSDKAKLLISTTQEENKANEIAKEINTLSGAIGRLRDDLVDLPDKKSLFVMDRQPVRLILNDESCRGIYLEEVQREQLYRIRYYPYRRMEV